MVPVLGDLGSLILFCVLVALYLLSYLYERYLTGCLGGNELNPQPASVTAAATPPPPARRRLAYNAEIFFDTYIKENSKEDDVGGCTICLEEYKDGETRAAIMACNHRFHAACIKAWLEGNDNCPLCRTHVV